MTRHFALALALSATPAAAQDFYYPDFSSLAGLKLNGNAGQAGNILTVTPAANSMRGSVFYDQPVDVSQGFQTSFTFSFTSLACGGADGMTFIIHNSAMGLSALGGGGSGMGYGIAGQAIDNSLVIEFDTWNSGGFGDTDDNHVSVHTMGAAENDIDEAFSLGRKTVPFNMSDTLTHVATIRYTPGLLEVFIDDPVNPLLSIPYDFVAGGTYANGTTAPGLDLLNGDSAYVGFTAATGGCNEDHNVHDWAFFDPFVGTNYCGPSNLNSTGSSAVLSAIGTESVSANVIELVAEDLPPNQYAVFLNSQTTGFSGGYGGSQGNLCLGGAIGFHANLVGSTGAAGVYAAALDLTQVPTPSGNVAIQPGETWHWQCWYRDKNPNRTSNMTDGLTITFVN